MVTILNFLVVLMPRNEKNTIQRFEENDKLNKSSSLHLVILRKEDVASAAAVQCVIWKAILWQTGYLRYTMQVTVPYRGLSVLIINLHSPFATCNMSDTCDTVLKKKVVWGSTLQYNSLPSYFKDCISTHCPMSVVLLLHSLRETFPISPRKGFKSEIKINLISFKEETGENRRGV